MANTPRGGSWAPTLRRRREARLAGRQLLGPGDQLLAVLPLEQQDTVRDLDPIPIDLEYAEDCTAVDLQNGVTELLALQRSGAPDGLDQDLATAVARRSVVGEISAGELLPVRLDKLPCPGVLPCNRDQAAGSKLDELRHPGRGAVD